jgi:uncharacterized protein with FMN-binding domain
MRRAAIAIAATVLGLILLLTFRPDPDAGEGSAPPVSSAPAATPTSASPTRSAVPAGDHVVTGDTVTTAYGPVQVRVTIVAGRITHVTALRLPNALPLDTELSRPAAIKLEQAVVASQSADVDSISGATYTSEGYLQSVQSAIDKLRA